MSGVIVWTDGSMTAAAEQSPRRPGTSGGRQGDSQERQAMVGRPAQYRFAGTDEPVSVLRFTRHGVLVTFADGRIDVVERHRTTLL